MSEEESASFGESPKIREAFLAYMRCPAGGNLAEAARSIGLEYNQFMYWARRFGWDEERKRLIDRKHAEASEIVEIEASALNFRHFQLWNAIGAHLQHHLAKKDRNGKVVPLTLPEVETAARVASKLQGGQRIAAGLTADESDADADQVPIVLEHQGIRATIEEDVERFKEIASTSGSEGIEKRLGSGERPPGAYSDDEVLRALATAHGDEVDG